MTKQIDGDFDGFIFPDGGMVSIKDTGRMFSFFIMRHDDPGEIKRDIGALAMECVEKGYYRAAHDYFKKILSLADAPSEKADCLLRMGLAMEQLRDYKGALDAYSRGLELEQESKEIWYFINNNSGYCLNQIGQYQDAERYCRAAIEIDPERHNACKNLGVALQNQGKFAEAAENFIQATKLNPIDSRALDHLEDLIANHREILDEVPGLLDRLGECRRLVEGPERKFYVQ